MFVLVSGDYVENFEKPWISFIRAAEHLSIRQWKKARF